MRRLNLTEEQLIERNFLSQIEPVSSGCWMWRGRVAWRYGTFRLGTRSWSPGYRAHRFSYTHFIGAVPEGLELDHLCRVPLCVNPTHLEPVTHRENVRRGRSVEAVRAWAKATFTHCPQGHPYGDDHRGRGGHGCPVCHREREDRRRTGIVPAHIAHGLASTYNNYACRCAACKQAQADYYQRRRFAHFKTGDRSE